MISQKLTLLILLLISAVIGQRKFFIRNNRIYDSDGGEIIFHGVNINQKRFPYYDNITGEQLRVLQQTGINGIRLGVMWAGVQPREDYFDSKYLERMVNLVNEASKYRIYTLVEFHQDLFSQKFCGNGVPLWAVPK
jgi:endoglycosylceramidase